MKKVPFFLSLLILLLSSCSQRETESVYDPVAAPLPTEYPQSSERQALSRAEAIEFAENFIRRNGYTDLPPDKENLTHESVEWESKADDLLRSRHDTLDRKAFGISTDRKSGASGWTVVFRYKRRPDHQSRENGRAVTMNPDGGDIRVEHVDFVLRKVKKRLPPS